MATFTWTVLAVDVSTEVLFGYNDIVTVVYWKCAGEQDGYTATLSRNSRITYDPATYVPYPDLTEAQMLAWIFAADGLQANTEAEIQRMLNAQITPPVIQPALPWAN